MLNLSSFYLRILISVWFSLMYLLGQFYAEKNTKNGRAAGERFIFISLFRYWENTVTLMKTKDG